jgi:hypothetical protein
MATGYRLPARWREAETRNEVTQFREAEGRDGERARNGQPVTGNRRSEERIPSLESLSLFGGRTGVG